MSQTFIATAPYETISIVEKELKSLGISKIEPGFKSIEFESDKEVAYMAHLKLRNPSRILRVLKKGSGSSLAIITNQAMKTNWLEVFKNNSTYLVEGVAGDKGPTSPDSTQISKAIRQGLEKYFEKKGLPIPKVDLKNPKIKVIGFVYNKRLTISVDSSGKSLHKRGFKAADHPAPIKETLAASILDLVGYDGSQVIYDPMCGSGTIAVEACYISLNKAPLIHRKKGEFAFENFADFDNKLWRTVQDKVRAEKSDDVRAPIFASDISPKFIEMAKANALKARAEKYITFKQENFLDSTPPADSGIIICNLPYGERIGSGGIKDLKSFYSALGDHLKQNYSGWKVGFLTAIDSPHKFIGLKPSRKIPIKNGSIECRLFIYELYQGSRKASKNSADVEIHK